MHGFSIPGLLGLVDADGNVPQPTRIDDLMLPPVAYGVKVISIGMFLRRTDGEAPVGAVAWRGPMLHRTVQQFLTDVYFGDLDVLLLDMPPGTGDIAISVGQLLPNAEVLVVTTPQAAASDVAVRSGLVARQTGQRVTGVVENMAAMTLPDGTTLELFGAGGGAEVADALFDSGEPVRLLGSIPLSPRLRADGGCRHPGRRRAPDGPRRGRDRRARRGHRGRAARSGRPLAAAAAELTPSRWLRCRTAAGRRRVKAASSSAASVLERTGRGDRGRGARGAYGRDGRVVQQRLADDAARVVLARIERAPVDVVEVRAHLVLHARLGGRDVLPRALRRTASRLSDIARQSLGPDEQPGDQSDQQKLLDREPEEHAFRLPPRLSGSAPPVRVG